MKRKVIFLLFFMLTSWQGLLACEVCKKNQPAPLRGITHGIGPTGTIDYIIISIASVIVAVTLYLSIKYMVKPKEGDVCHIKNIVLNEN